MIKFDRVFISFLKKEFNEIELDQDFLNKYFALSLLTCLKENNSISQSKNFLKIIISNNYIFTTNQIQYLVDKIIEIQPFQLLGSDLLLDSVKSFLLENCYLILDDQTQCRVEQLGNNEAEERVRKLMTLFTSYLESEVFVKFDLSSQQKSKQFQAAAAAEDSSIFPYALNGIFQRQIILDLFPNENEPFQKFQQHIAMPENAYDLIQLPQQFRKGFVQQNEELKDEKPHQVYMSDVQKEEQEELKEQKVEQELNDNRMQELKLHEQYSLKQRNNSNSQMGQSSEQNTQQIIKNDDPVKIIDQKQNIQQQNSVQEIQKEEKPQQMQNIVKESSHQTQNISNQVELSFEPLVLQECIDYYNNWNSQYGDLEKNLKNCNSQSQVKQIINQQFDDIYDITFKTIYFDTLINEQTSDELKRCAEIFLIKNYIKARQSSERQFFSGCQNFVYTAIMMLLFYNHQSFYKLFVGATLSSLPQLITDYAYYFNVSVITIEELEFFFQFQMLILFDNPSYFQKQVSFRQNFLLRYLNYYFPQKSKQDFNLEKHINILQSYSQDAVEFQKKISHEYFKLVTNSKIEDLSKFLITIQMISNNNKILEIEKILKDEKTDPNKQQNLSKNEEDPTWTEELEQIEQIYIEVFFFNKQKHLLSLNQLNQLNNMKMPQLVDISIVNLAEKLKSKIDSNMINQFNQLHIKGCLINLRLYFTGKCPNFGLKYLPHIDTIKQLKSRVRLVYQEIEKIKSAGKQEKEQIKIQSNKNFEVDFGDNLSVIFEKLLSCGSTEECEELTKHYFPILFFEYVEQKLKQDKI